MENNKGFWLIAPIVLVLAVILAVLPNHKFQKETPPQDILLLSVRGSQFYTVDQVAEMMVNEDPSLMLIDLRSPAKYEAYHPDVAVNIPFDSILNKQWFETITQPGIKAIFYSNDDALAQAAWLATRRMGATNTFVMKGGLNEWFATIINPPLPGDKDDITGWALYRKRMGARQRFTGVGMPGTQVKTEEPVKKESKKVIKPTVQHHGAAEGGC